MRRPAADEAEADRALDLFDFLRDVALAAPDDIAEQLDSRAWKTVDEAAPVRVSYAARILGVREQSLRPWLDRGALDVVEGASPHRVTLASLAELREIVDELRAEGYDKRVISAAMARFESESLARNGRFRHSVDQMARRERARLPY